MSNSYESCLKSYIYDDDKLVTYKWLSKELEVHVNVAKDILKKFWEKYKNESEIVATFLLIGQLPDQSIRVEVVKESNLSTAKSKFQKIDCEHLYSLQKHLEDIDLLSQVGDGDLRYSAIKCNEEYLRNDEADNSQYMKEDYKEESRISEFDKEIDKNSKQQISTEKSKKEKFVSSKTDESKNKNVNSKEKETNEHKSETKSSEKKISPTSKINNNIKGNNKAGKKPLQSKQSGFNNLFGKTLENKSKVSSESKKISNNESIDEDDISTNSNEKTDESKAYEKENKKGHGKEDEKKSQEDKSKNISKSKNNTNLHTKSKNKQDNNKKRTKSQEKNTTKRKRIITIESSEDESHESNNEEDEEPMEIETPQVIRKKSPSPPAEKRENGKRMVRKTIDKTYKDEDGYIVTKRVHVYEAVDDEPVEVIKKEERPKSKPVDNKAKKQTTLMSFFKKS